jgi:hypothetical protein
MKKLFLIIILVSLTSVAVAQTNKEKYKDYKSCTECFDKWKKSNTGLENYGIPSPVKTKNSFARQQLRGFVAIVGGIFVTAITYSIYNKVNQTANGIR